MCHLWQFPEGLSLSKVKRVRHNTEANYNIVVNIFKKEDFGKKRVDKIKLSDAKCWLIKL